MATAHTPRPIHVVVGTAGHIDHGKTSLVQRLTGVDTDRLPEEKRRGITIVLGFAPLDLPDGTRVGVVDVPGHERFVKNMVAGAGGVDLVLLVVAADEGVMPQTREHLEICQLLGIDRGLVALTKVDKAGPELTELAIEDVKSHLAATPFSDSPILPCSAVTGEGIEQVLDTLQTMVQQTPRPEPTGRPLLAIDRVFNVKGFGSVVTGTLLEGRLSVGDEVEVLPPIPGRGPVEGARVRSVQVFHEKVETAVAGDRTAVSLANVSREQLRPGQLLTRPGASRPTRAIDVELNYLASRSKALKTGAKAMFHLGTDLTECGITLLDQDKLAPGEGGFARIRLTDPLPSLRGQRFILRGFDGADEKAGRTIAGGRVLDPDPVRRRRNDPRALSALESLSRLTSASPDDFSNVLADAIAALVAEVGARGAERANLMRRTGVSERALDKAIDRAVKAKAALRIGELVVNAPAVESISDEVLAVIESFHKELPFRPAISHNELASRLKRRASSPVIERAAKQLIGMNKLELVSEGYHLPSHRPFGGAAEDVRRQVISTIESAGLTPPNAEDVRRETELNPKDFKELMGALVRTGELIRVSPALVYGREAFEQGRKQVVDFIDSEGSISAQQAKELTGLSRKYLIPLLEAFDKAQITVRVGEVRKLGPKAKNP